MTRFSTFHNFKVNYPFKAATKLMFISYNMWIYFYLNETSNEMYTFN